MSHISFCSFFRFAPPCVLLCCWARRFLLIAAVKNCLTTHWQTLMAATANSRNDKKCPEKPQVEVKNKSSMTLIFPFSSLIIHNIMRRFRSFNRIECSGDAAAFSLWHHINESVVQILYLRPLTHVCTNYATAFPQVHCFLLSLRVHIKMVGHEFSVCNQNQRECSCFTCTSFYAQQQARVPVPAHAS